MARLSWSQSKRRQILPNGADESRVVKIALVLPLLLLIAAVAVLTLCCGELLQRAATGRPAIVGSTLVYLASGAFLFASGIVVVVQSLRVASRVAGPERRLKAALQRIRTGDIGFRITLRRGDLLGDLAGECNALLDWLNSNPPGSVRTGGDLVELAAAPEDGAIGVDDGAVAEELSLDEVAR